MALFKLFFLVGFFVSCCCVNVSFGARKLNELYEPPAMVLKYHNGALLDGDVPVSLLWYGKFTPAQKSIVADFILSLSQNDTSKSSFSGQPSVSEWWKRLETYLKRAGKQQTRLVLSDQVDDAGCSLGKTLKRSDIAGLTRHVNSKLGELVLVLTAEDVVVDGFCMSSCGFHGSDKARKSAYIWVGNSVTRCPGQCAWPFHQPIYGPQDKPLIAPNGDVGVDGMIVNIASLLAGTVTNPFGNGYYQGSAAAPLEAASACPGIYGRGAYPGYAGQLLVDPGTGGSYNAQGVNGRKFLLPALFDPLTSQCSPIV